jgi:hypothetical protein
MYSKTESSSLIVNCVKMKKFSHKSWQWNQLAGKTDCHRKTAVKDDDDFSFHWFPTLLLIAELVETIIQKNIATLCQKD